MEHLSSVGASEGTWELEELDSWGLEAATHQSESYKPRIL